MNLRTEEKDHGERFWVISDCCVGYYGLFWIRDFESS